jgi:spore coat protein A
VKFDGYAGRYVYHCHMLEHEDNDMMRPYEVVL